MRILIPSESAAGETRVAATPETIKKFLDLGCSASLEEGAGNSSGFIDEDYRAVGAEIVRKDDTTAWSEAEIILCVQSPTKESIEKLSKGALLVGLLAPFGNKELINDLTTKGLSALALELLPRISRAQSADALSSQANIAGYKAVLVAASALDRYLPMLMTAAGTVQPAKVVVLGAGVAGLQAVATAKRLGAVVYVSDIRAEVKEQVESLGARFIEPPKVQDKSESSGGYAKQSSEEFLKKQRQQLSDQLSEADIAICTAQVPGKKAPRLIDEQMISRMRRGSVIVDLAVAQGGNCAKTLPGKTVIENGVKLIGGEDLPCSVPNHASSLYSRNLLSLLKPLIKDGKIDLSLEDELIAGSLITHNGEARLTDLFNQGGNH